jgi:hypothetical protein
MVRLGLAVFEEAGVEDDRDGHGRNPGHTYKMKAATSRSSCDEGGRRCSLFVSLVDVRGSPLLGTIGYFQSLSENSIQEVELVV